MRATNYGRAFRLARQLAGEGDGRLRTQRAFAARLHVRAEHVSRIENGATLPSLDLLERAAEVAGVSPVRMMQWAVDGIAGTGT